MGMAEEEGRRSALVHLLVVLGHLLHRFSAHREHLVDEPVGRWPERVESRRGEVDGKLRGGDLDPNLDCEHAQLHHARVLLHELGRLGDLEARVLGLHGRLLQLAGRVLVQRHLLRGRGSGRGRVRVRPWP